MPGVKGQKWSADKRRPSKKCNIAVPMKNYEIIEKMARDNNISISKCLNWIIDNYLSMVKKNNNVFSD